MAILMRPAKLAASIPRRARKIVITGFNTDIEHEGVIYHVQTEDKGVSTPLILSLVYNRGTILASKRSPYDDLLVPAFNEKALSERLQKQHKLICAAVRAGRIEDLKRMGKESSAGAPPKNNNAPQKQVKTDAVKAETPAAASEVSRAQAPAVELKKPPAAPPQPRRQQELPQIAKQKNSTVNQPKQNLPDAPAVVPPHKVENAKSEIDVVFDVPLEVVEDELIVEAVAIVEDETILPAEAVAVVADEIETVQVAENILKIELPGDITFRSGERKTVGISVYRGAREQAASGAHVMIKVFGAAFRPLIFHAKTDVTGTANVHLQMPHFKGGRAAVFIKAMCDGDEAELRRAIEQ
jgi:hypothetical protein